MVENKKIWEELRKLLKENFPNDTEKELEEKFNELKNHDYDEKELEVYAPSFHGIILRVGIRCKGTTKCSYFITEEECKLREILE